MSRNHELSIEDLMSMEAAGQLVYNVHKEGSRVVGAQLGGCVVEVDITEYTPLNFSYRGSLVFQKREEVEQ